MKQEQLYTYNIKYKKNLLVLLCTVDVRCKMQEDNLIFLSYDTSQDWLDLSIYFYEKIKDKTRLL